MRASPYSPKVPPQFVEMKNRDRLFCLVLWNPDFLVNNSPTLSPFLRDALSNFQLSLKLRCLPRHLPPDSSLSQGQEGLWVAPAASRSRCPHLLSRDNYLYPYKPLLPSHPLATPPHSLETSEPGSYFSSEPPPESCYCLTSTSTSNTPLFGHTCPSFQLSVGPTVIYTCFQFSLFTRQVIQSQLG